MWVTGQQTGSRKETFLVHVMNYINVTTVNKKKKSYLTAMINIWLEINNLCSCRTQIQMKNPVIIKETFIAEIAQLDENNHIQLNKIDMEAQAEYYFDYIQLEDGL